MKNLGEQAKCPIDKKLCSILGILASLLLLGSTGCQLDFSKAPLTPPEPPDQVELADELDELDPDALDQDTTVETDQPELSDPCDTCPDSCCLHQGSMQCVDKQTNPNHCGACGVRCDAEERCFEGECCQPLSCEAQRLSCGTWSDQCGETLDCGSCPSPEICSGYGRDGLCTPPLRVPDSATQYCIGSSDGSCPNDPSQDLWGQDGCYQSGPASYTFSDGTIEQGYTGLRWQQAYAPRSSHDDASSYCASLTLAGFDDWRLPTLYELATLHDWGKRDGASYLDPLFSIDATGEGVSYWSSDERDTGSYWSLSPVTGEFRASTQAFVRCVRGQGLDNVFALQGNAALDRSTGLRWRGGTAGSWAEALSFCETLSSDGISNWRLPTLNELLSVLAYSPGPRLASFLGSSIGTLWTATPDAREGDGLRVFVVNLGSLTIDAQASTSNQQSFCVHSDF
ncbi:MAG: DUF1566 domain-containing protein [Myxococcota bacterium]|jgi:hypothetical protein|nr:DUF1566 domain-containing protein [Myxococcota bacterium]